MDDSRTVLRNEPRSWVEHKIDGVILPSTIGSDVEFDPAQDRYASRQEKPKKILIYQGAESEKAKLLSAMIKFQTKHKLNIDIDPQRFQTFEEVVLLLQQMERQYENKKGLRRCFRTLFQTLGNHSQKFSAWLSLLPSGEYSSVICGAFKLVVMAAVKAKDVREAIFTALSDMPAALENANIYSRMWSSVKLHQAFSDLCTSILKVLENIFAWLSEPGILSAAKAFVKQDDYGKRHLAQIDKVKQNAASVREEADICSQWVIGSIDEKLDRQTIQVDGMKVTIEGLKQGVEGVGGALSEIKNVTARTADTLTAFYCMLKDIVRDFHNQKEISDKLQSKGDRQVAQYNQQQLCELLGHERQTTVADVQKVTAHGHSLSLSEQERTEYFVNSRPFKAWFTSQHSALMLVNGNADVERISSMSFAGGLLVRAFQRSGVLVPSFFCGLHTNSKHEDILVRQLVAGLACQLLTAWDDWDLSFLTTESIARLKDNSMRMLCRLFANLIKQLPEGQLVFCVMDGINYYETRFLQQDLLAFFSMLKDLNKDAEVKAVVKILITTPVASRCAGQILDKEQIVDVPKELDHTGQGFNSLVIGREAKGQAKMLERNVQTEATHYSDGSNDNNVDDEESEPSE